MTKAPLMKNRISNMIIAENILSNIYKTANIIKSGVMVGMVNVYEPIDHR